MFYSTCKSYRRGELGNWHSGDWRKGKVANWRAGALVHSLLEASRTTENGTCRALEITRLRTVEQMKQGTAEL